MGFADIGQVGEWLKPTDCKSVAPGLRRFESSPVHQICREWALVEARRGFRLSFQVRAVVAQLVERVLGKDEVTSSILVNGSIYFPAS